MRIMKIVTIIPLEKNVWKGNLTYFTSKEINLGDIVTIPLRGRKTFGYVSKLEDASTLKSDIKELSFKLKRVIDIKENIWRNEFMEATQKYSRYFCLKENISISHLIPVIFLEKYNDFARILKKYEVLPNEQKSNNEKNLKPEKILFQNNLEDRVAFYKTLVRGQFALKKSVFLVLPRERNIEAFYKDLSKGIENFVFFIHNKLKPKEFLETYEKIISSPHGVLIIGTPPFLSIPRKDLSTIILEEEGGNSYKIFPEPRANLKVFVEIFAYTIGAKFILGDTLLSFETITRKNTESLGEVYPLSYRMQFEGDIDIRNKNKKEGSFGILSEETKKDISEAIQNKKNVFVFSLRKGLATRTVCRDCGETLECDKCLAPLVLYISKNKKDRMFACNKCNTEKDSNTLCRNCGGWRLVPLGIGVDAVYEEMTEIFPETNIFRLDRESAKNAKEAEKIIQNFEKNPGSVLIGTEMAFFYLRQKCFLSVIASFDSLWSIPDFRMSEKILQILLAIMKNTERKIIIQTKNTNDPALLAFKSGNYSLFVKEEIEERRVLNYPPFMRFIKVSFQGDRNNALKARNFLTEYFKDYNPEIFGGFMKDEKSIFTANALLRIKPEKWSTPEILVNSKKDEHLEKLLRDLPEDFSIEIDPENLL